MIDDAAKTNLYNYLKHEREAVLGKLDGLSEYDVRRPLTVTGTKPTCSRSRTSLAATSSTGTDACGSTATAR